MFAQEMDERAMFFIGHPNRDQRGTDTLGVLHRRAGNEKHLPSRLIESQAPVEVLEMHEVVAVEEAVVRQAQAATVDPGARGQLEILRHPAIENQTLDRRAIVGAVRVRRGAA